MSQPDLRSVHQLRTIIGRGRFLIKDGSLPARLCDHIQAKREEQLLEQRHARDAAAKARAQDESAAAAAAAAELQRQMEVPSATCVRLHGLETVAKSLM